METIGREDVGLEGIRCGDSPTHSFLAASVYHPPFPSSSLFAQAVVHLQHGFQIVFDH